MTNYKAIVFDFDGTLVDTFDIKTKAFGAMYQNYGDKIYKKVINYHTKNEGINRELKFKFWHKNYLNKTLSSKDLKALSNEFTCIVKDQIISAPFIDGAYDFLLKSSKNKKLFVASSIPDSELKQLLKKKGIFNFFKKTYGYPKNKTSILKKIISDDDNLSKNNIIFIGDTKTDYLASLETKVRFIGVGDKIKMQYREVQTINSYDELYKIL